MFSSIVRYLSDSVGKGRRPPLLPERFLPLSGDLDPSGSGFILRLAAPGDLDTEVAAVLTLDSRLLLLCPEEPILGLV